MQKRLQLAPAVAALAAVLAGCNRQAPKPATQTVTPAAAQSVIEVVTSEAKRTSISDTAMITGTLGSLNDVVVGIKNAGKLVGVYAREGDQVHAGQVLAQQDTNDINSQIMLSQANLRSAQTRLDQAKVAYDSAQTNLKLTDQTTRQAVDQAKAALQSAQDSLILIKRGARAQELAESRKAVDSAQADLESAQADQTQAVSDLKRYQGLHDARAISDQQLDQAKTVKLSADARVKSTGAKLDSAKQAYSLLEEGAQKEDINRSQAQVDSAAQALRTAQSNRANVDMRRSDVETAKSSIGTSQAAVQVARAQLAVAEQALRDSSVRSPVDGVVAERKAEPGQQMAITKPDVMRIISLKAMYFDGQLSQNQYAGVQVGQPVQVTVDGLQGMHESATITRIFPVASTNARSFTVRVSITNSHGALRPQMFAHGRITLGQHNNAIVAPAAAVINEVDTGKTKTGVVFIVQNGKAVRRAIDLGYTNVRYDEILRGIAAGDEVITVGQAQVQNGDAVKVTSGGQAP